MIRPFGEEDVAPSVAMFNEIAQAAYGVDDTSEAELRLVLSEPAIEPERDMRVIERDGTIAGYADVFDQNGWHTRYWCDIRVHSERGDSGVAESLVAWCEERARSNAQNGAFLRTYVPTEYRFLHEVLHSRGFDVIRASYRMAIDLDAEHEPEWPAGISVRSMQPGEERAVYDVNEECFADHWEHVPEPYEEWAHWTVNRDDFDPGLWFLALDGDEIAGYSLCLPHDGQQDTGWVGNLGVRRPWRRRGLGEALLKLSFAEFRRRGFKRAGLGVDAENLTGAVRLYERAGMHLARRSNCYEKRLGDVA
jgi:mycothiol synthase